MMAMAIVIVDKGRVNIHNIQWVVYKQTNNDDSDDDSDVADQITSRLQR